MRAATVRQTEETVKSKPYTKRDASLYRPPGAPGIVVEYIHHPYTPGSAPGYSHLGSPPTPAHVEIMAVTIGNENVMGWLIDHGLNVDQLADEIMRR